MSRMYQMAVKVSGMKKEKMAELLEVLAKEFWVNEAKEKLDSWSQEGDKWFQRNKDGTYWFWLTEEGLLNGGESEEDFAIRVHKKVWGVSPQAEVIIRATYLEDLPYEEYSFTKNGGKRDCLCK